MVKHGFMHFWQLILQYMAMALRIYKNMKKSPDYDSKT